MTPSVQPNERIIYRVPAPYGQNIIEVYGAPENARYEWRLVTPAGVVLRGTTDMGYGDPAIALRDALIDATIARAPRSGRPAVWRGRFPGTYETDERNLA
jgi:hypothetical protein